MTVKKSITALVGALVMTSMLLSGCGSKSAGAERRGNRVF